MRCIAILICAFLTACASTGSTDRELEAMYVEVRSELREMGLSLDHDTPVRFAEHGELERNVMARTTCNTWYNLPMSIKFRHGWISRVVMAHELVHVQECLDGEFKYEGGPYERHANVREVLTIWSAKYQ
tara:strand:+ start:1140 stop:1529 length:390 start_codon:yes stop_codon:yes gene_type:complete